MEDLNDLEILKKKVTEKIIERLELDLELEDVSYTAPLFSSMADGDGKNLGLDSVDGLELVVMLYESWGIKVQAEEMPTLTTIERIADFIRRKFAEKTQE